MAVYACDAEGFACGGDESIHLIRVALGGEVRVLGRAKKWVFRAGMAECAAVFIKD
jgi:non-ribosomal peptide synthetase component E (peptide arylation enzyme)